MKIQDEVLFYYGCGLTNEEILSVTNFKRIQILSVLGRNKLKSNKPALKTIDVDNELYSFIVGSMLGDGCISGNRKLDKYYTLNFGHGQKQLGYLKWKKQFLESKGIKCSKVVKCISYNKRYKQPTISYHFKSEINRLFKQLRYKFYPKGVKLLPRDLVISPLALTIWFMDDASKATRSYQFHTCGFSVKDCKWLIKYLFKTYGLSFNFQKDNTLYLQSVDIPSFNVLIIPYLLNYFKYKLITNKIIRFYNPVSNKREEVLYKLGEFSEKPIKLVNTELSFNLKD